MPEQNTDTNAGDNKPGGLTPKTRLLAMAVAALIGAGVGLGLWTFFGPEPGPKPGTATQPVYSGIADIGGPWALTSHDGKTVTDEDFPDAFKLIYFGYTYCPDVCPLSLLFMQDVMSELGPDASDIQPLFITVDPQRDTPDVLKSYLGSFDPRLIGLTGTPEQIQDVAAAYKMFFRRAEQPGAETSREEESYLLDHLNIFYLMAPDGSYAAHFMSPTSPVDVAKTIRKHL